MNEMADVPGKSQGDDCEALVWLVVTNTFHRIML
jgi:hypothetical protein